MPTVYLPLGSAAASGSLGDLIVYQGVTCRSYSTPTDPRTSDQLDVRHLFYDITKMVRTAGPWARAVWKTQYGPRWFTVIYQHCKLDAFGGFAQGQTYWDGYSTAQKDHLDAVAPFRVTYSEPGRIFLCLLQTLYFDTENLPIPAFDVNDWEEGNIADALDFWTRDLSTALQSGIFASDDPLLTFSGSWTSVTDALAYHGKYARANVVFFPNVDFYWYGNVLKIGYIKGVGFGSVEVDFEVGDPLYFDEAAGSTLYDNEWVSPTLTKGLHHCTIYRHGSGVATFDRLTVTGTLNTRTKLQKTVVGEGILPAGVVLPYGGSLAPDGFLLCDGGSYSRTDYPRLFTAIGTGYGAIDGTHFSVPDLRGRVPVGAGAGVGDGASGSGLPAGTALTVRAIGDWFGEQAHLLVTGEMPAHAHGVTDGGHNHAVTNPTHNHGITDAGHVHGVTDPQHAHTQRGVSVAGALSRVSFTTTKGATEVSLEATANAATGVTVVNAVTGLVLAAVAQVVSLAAAVTGISLGNAGGGGSHNNLPPAQVVNFIIRT
jgi:microcystin-dependent protein